MARQLFWPQDSSFGHGTALLLAQQLFYWHSSSFDGAAFDAATARLVAQQRLRSRDSSFDGARALFGGVTALFGGATALLLARPLVW